MVLPVVLVEAKNGRLNHQMSKTVRGCSKDIGHAGVRNQGTIAVVCNATSGGAQVGVHGAEGQELAAIVGVFGVHI